MQRSRFLYTPPFRCWGFFFGSSLYFYSTHKLFSKVTVKTFIMLQRFLLIINAVCLNFIFIKNSALQNMKEHNCLNIDNNVMFLEQHISEDHVTLKDWINDAENSALHHRNKLHFTIYSHRKQLF